MLVNYPIKRFEMKFFLAGLILFLGFYTAVSVFTVHYDFLGGQWQSQSLSRLILHYFPLCPLLVSVGLYQVLKGNQKCS